MIIGYKVFYVDQANSTVKLQKNVSSSTLSVELNGLLVYTNYCIQVLAITRKGDGPLSDCIVAKTAEGSMQSVYSELLYTSVSKRVLVQNFSLKNNLICVKMNP